MRMATCRCGSNGTVTVQGVGLHSRTFGQGSRVDLDQIINDQGQTMAGALERYLHLFEDDVLLNYLELEARESSNFVRSFDVVHEKVMAEE